MNGSELVKAAASQRRTEFIPFSIWLERNKFRSTFQLYNLCLTSRRSRRRIGRGNGNESWSLISQAQPVLRLVPLRPCDRRWRRYNSAACNPQRAHAAAMQHRSELQPAVAARLVLRSLFMFFAARFLSASNRCNAFLRRFLLAIRATLFSFGLIAQARRLPARIGRPLGIGGRFHMVGPCPGPALFHGGAATVRPAFFGVAATAGIVLAREALRVILRSREWKRQTQRHGQIANRRQRGRQPAGEFSPELFAS